MKKLMIAFVVLYSASAFATATTLMIHGSVSSEESEAVVRGSVVTSRGIDPDRVRAVVAKGLHFSNKDHIELSDCRDAFVTVRAEAGTFLPGADGSEATIESFSCADVATHSTESASN